MCKSKLLNKLLTYTRQRRHDKYTGKERKEQQRIKPEGQSASQRRGVCSTISGGGLSAPFLVGGQRATGGQPEPDSSHPRLRFVLLQFSMKITIFCHSFAFF